MLKLFILTSPMPLTRSRISVCFLNTESAWDCLLVKQVSVLAGDRCSVAFYKDQYLVPYCS